MKHASRVHRCGNDPLCGKCCTYSSRRLQHAGEHSKGRAGSADGTCTSRSLTPLVPAAVQSSSWNSLPTSKSTACVSTACARVGHDCASCCSQRWHAHLLSVHRGCRNALISSCMIHIHTSLLVTPGVLIQAATPRTHAHACLMPGSDILMQHARDIVGGQVGHGWARAKRAGTAPL